MGFFEKIKAGLTKTRQSLQNTLGGIFAGFHGIDDDFYDDLEESLILADLGVDTAVKAVEQLRERVNMEHLKSADEVREALKDILVEMLDVGDTQLKTYHPAQHRSGDRRQRRGQNYHHRQAGPSAEERREKGAAVRGGYLPCGGGGSAGDLGRTRRGGHHPAARGSRPCGGGVRRHFRRQGQSIPT